jgi:4-amino-4-deoxy-L-arabinose transferase-like glycosyltransferase
MTRSWHSLFYNSADLSNFVSIDKTPLALWLMALSSRIFGFGSFSMLLPNALSGVGAVVLLHDLVRRTLGHRAAILAALLLALTPVSVLMARFNNPDAVLVFLLVAAAWAIVRALESGRTRHVLLCGVLIGLAFNTKMLQAYLILPSVGLTYLIAGPPRVARRLAQLAAGGVAMLGVSAVWVVTMMLIPSAERPYVGDSTGNSWWDLIWNANGLGRVGSASGGPGGPPGGAGLFSGPRGIGRLFDTRVGGDTAWLIPLAVVGLLTGLWLTRRRGRRDLKRAGYVLWGTWGLVTFAIFSFELTLFHPYYTNALAPAIAVLAAGGLVALWDSARASWLAGSLLGAALLATTALADVLLGRASGWETWLRPLVVVLGVLAAIGVLARRARHVEHSRFAGAVGVIALSSVLLGPAAFSIATVGQHPSGGNPQAGPASTASDPGRFAVDAAADPALVRYLEAHRGGARYLVAANGSMTAAPIVLASHQPVIAIGGFGGGDPAPTTDQLKRLIQTRQVRYVLVGGIIDIVVRGPTGLPVHIGPGAPGAGSPIGGAATPGAPVAPFGSGASSAGAAQPGPPGAESGGGIAGRNEPDLPEAGIRNIWVQTHCQAVTVPGTKPSTDGAPGNLLFDCVHAT